MDTLPPPYSTTSPTSTSSPYNNTSPYTTTLPAFDAPRKYSSRLRRLLQQRSNTRGVYLTVHIPSNFSKCTLVSIASASTDSSASSTNSSCSSRSISEKQLQVTEKTPLLSGLSAGIPFVEDLEAATFQRSKKSKKSRRSNGKNAGRLPRNEKETSWLAFFALLLIAFTIVCCAAVFIAWATGFTSGRLSELAKMRVGNGNVVPAVPATTVNVSGTTAASTKGAFGGVGGFIQNDETVVEKEDAVMVKRSRVWRQLDTKKRSVTDEYLENLDVMF